MKKSGLHQRWYIQIVLLPFALLGNSGSAQEPQVVDVPKEIIKELKETSGFSDDIKLNSNGTARNLVAEPVDLSRNGTAELHVHGTGLDLCTLADNCPIWIYSKQGNALLLLLHEEDIQGIEIQETVTNGYFDLMTRHQGSPASESVLDLFKFDGKRYRWAACFHRSLSWNSSTRQWENPQTKPCEN